MAESEPNYRYPFSIPPSAVAICERCGALVWDTAKHDAFHEPTELSEACGDGEHACCGFPTCPCTCHEPTEQEQKR